MHLVIASFAIVILAIALLFSNRYDFIGAGDNVYRLDNFTGKIDKIEGSSVIKLDTKLSLKEIGDYKYWKEFKDKNLSAVLETRYIDEILFVKLKVFPSVRGFTLNKVTLYFYDSNDFLLKTVVLTKKMKFNNHLVFFGYSSVKIPIYVYLSQWQMEY
ncbi:MAG: hypothetical protein GXO22_06250 [Aquificae bacterium]|nr:hypothetical protein [Aquificota bacterium]